MDTHSSDSDSEQQEGVPKPSVEHYFDVRLKEIEDSFEKKLSFLMEEKKKDTEEEIRRKNYIKIGKKFPHLGYGEVIEFEEKVRKMGRVKVHSGRFKKDKRLVYVNHTSSNYDSRKYNNYKAWDCCHNRVNNNQYKDDNKTAKYQYGSRYYIFNINLSIEENEDRLNQSVILTIDKLFNEKNDWVHDYTEMVHRVRIDGVVYIAGSPNLLDKHPDGQCDFPEWFSLEDEEVIRKRKEEEEKLKKQIKELQDKLKEVALPE